MAPPAAAAAGWQPGPDLPQQQRKLQILCLHGSRQDGEVFAQRLKTLRKKLSSIADLHFASAPHTLPLQPGQAVAMRAWWRHWNVLAAEEPAALATQHHHDQQQQQQEGSSLQHQDGAAAGALQPQPSLPHGRERDEEVAEKLAGGWEAVVLADWAESLSYLCDLWRAGPPVQLASHAASSSSSNSSSSAASAAANNAAGAGGDALPPPLLEYDGVLGFSNGAAAAFLLAAHAAAHPQQFSSLRFVALAGGYVPEPLAKLLPAALLLPAGAVDDGGGGIAPAARLRRPLPFASLHMMGANDPLMDVGDSSQLMDCFQEAGRLQLVHDSGHAVPQQSRHTQDILQFLAGFAELPLPLGQHHKHRPHGPKPTGRQHQHQQRQQQPGAAAAAAAGGGGEAVLVEGAGVAEQQLHRQGLRDRAKKGPAHRHPLIRLDSSGQPHQHHDLLHSPKAATAHTPEQLQQQRSVGQLVMEAAAAAAAKDSQQQQPSQQQAHEPLPAAADSAAEFCEATEIQLEELEALEAIFGREYHLISSCPPTFTLKLRDPAESAAEGDEEAEDTQADGGEATGPPSRLFTLRFKLPKDYPMSPAALPAIDILGPLGSNDPARAALAAHLAAAAAQQQQELAGAGGFAWQLAEAAKEWIDAQLPPDIGSRRAGVAAAAAAAPDAAAGAAADAGGGAAAGSAAAGGRIAWWEKEDIDFDLVSKATAEAAAAHWSAWDASADEASALCDDDCQQQQQQQQQGEVAVAAAGFEGSRGRWDYTVGLVGKPSAGKSTFFNAVTDPAREEDAAREAPFPFTTIAPNVGRGLIVLPDPASLLSVSAQPAHGCAPGFDPSRIEPRFSNVGPLMQLAQDCGWQQRAGADDATGGGLLWRRVPVVVKDVAGLVPGAYKGRGRGNAFLADLCDADVLVHVVDASGTTDSEGAGAAAGEGADPRQEVVWVRQELHCWVYDNVRAKWPQVLRRPNRLPSLFSGYHAPSGLVAGVLRAVGVRLEDLVAEAAALGNAGLQGGTKELGGAAAAAASSSSLAAWGEAELHRLVAHFLAARFPILLALNKADLPSAQQHIPAVLQAAPHQAAVATSAAAERRLQQLRRAGRAAYDDAAATATLLPAVGDGDAGKAAAQLQAISETVLQRYGSTGVLAALTCAVALKPPRWVFPISDRETCAALPAVTSRAAGGSGSSSHNHSSSHSHKGGGGGRDGSSSVAGALGWGGDAKARLAQGGEPGVLRDCVLMKPGSRIEDVYAVLKRPPYGLLEGEFVRAECRVLPGCGAAAAGAGAGEQQPGKQCRVVRKDELVGTDNCVLLLQTNRKVSWQAGAGGGGGRKHH